MDLIIPLGFSLLYFVFFYSFGYFFEQPVKLTPKSFVSVMVVFLLSFLSYKLTFMFPDLELGNRFLHAFGGGFVSFILCFLVFKDSNVSVTRFQFFVFGFLIVTALGVANEILEFFLEKYLHKVFAINSTDTWLDLISNTVGAIFTGLILVNFIPKKKKE